VSRRERPPDLEPAVEWSQADLVDGDLGPAVRGASAVVHLASEKGAGEADVTGTRRLLAAALLAGVRHAVVISIVGCDRIPLPFYGVKVQVEEAVRAGGVPWSIVRVTQFHSFVERLVAAAGALPIPTPIAADLRFQPVDEREVAERLVEIAQGPPLGQAPEIAGPEILTLGQIADAWLVATGRPATLVPVPLAALPPAAGPPSPAAWAAAVLEGYHEAWNTPQGPRTLGRVRFTDWMRSRP
jgi:uncharacterized protein YbjT (DUF2867 family)